ncbi:MAG: DUF4920 domain-containing protein, partial [Acidobacteriota bacterium]
MKRTFGLMILILTLAVVSFSQEKMDKMSMEKSPTEADKIATFDKDGMIKRGAVIGNAKKASLAEVLKSPNKYEGKTVAVEGVIVRSCKMEGCWMELAPSKDAQSVRVKFKDHAFFIPLDSAGMKAKAEGIFSVKTLSKAEVD